MSQMPVAALAGTLAALLLCASVAQAHLPTETSAELRLREGTIELSVSVSALRLLGAPLAGEQGGSGAVAAGLRIAAALSEVEAVALHCGQAAVPLRLVSKLDGDALVAAASGADRHLEVQLRGDRPAEAALARGCRLFLPAAFGPYYAAMSAPRPVFAASGGWSEPEVTGFVSPPVAAAPAPPTRSPVGLGLFVIATTLLAARVGFVVGRRK